MPIRALDIVGIAVKMRDLGPSVQLRVDWGSRHKGGGKSYWCQGPRVLDRHVFVLQVSLWFSKYFLVL